MASHSQGYEEFLRSVKGSLVYKDDLALDAYESCPPAERAELDDLLAQELPKGDPRVARAVACLWPAARASATLTNAVAQAAPGDRPAITSALRMLTDATSLQALRTAVFDTNADPATRIRAAESLAQIDGAPASASLEVAIDEPVPELRLRAAQLLFERMHLASTASGSVLRRMLDSSWGPARDAAISEVKRVSEAGGPELAGPFDVTKWQSILDAMAQQPPALPPSK
jgi:hypothetical protein